MIALWFLTALACVPVPDGLYACEPVPVKNSFAERDECEAYLVGYRARVNESLKEGEKAYTWCEKRDVEEGVEE